MTDESDSDLPSDIEIEQSRSKPRNSSTQHNSNSDNNNNNEQLPTMTISNTDYCQAQINTIAAHTNVKLNTLYTDNTDRKDKECKKCDKTAFHVNHIHLTDSKFTCISGDEDPSDDYSVGPVVTSSDEVKEDDKPDYTDKIEVKTNEDIPYENTNIEFQSVGLGKEYISNASRYPPELDINSSVGVYDPKTNTSTSHTKDAAVSRPTQKHANFNGFEEIKRVQDGEGHLMGDTEVVILDQGTKRNFVINALSDVVPDNSEVNHNYTKIPGSGNVVWIENKTDKLILTVPIQQESGSVVDTKVLADPGADTGCIEEAYAVKYFSKYILNNDHTAFLHVPGGDIVRPKYVIWLTFPTATGKILKARMFLVKNLPMPILADINMLKAFGYKFPNEKPKIFRHPSQPDIDLDLKDFDEKHKIHEPQKWYKKFQKHRVNHVSFGTNTVHIPTRVPALHDAIRAGNKTLYDYQFGSLVPKHHTPYTKPELLHLNSLRWQSLGDLVEEAIPLFPKDIDNNRVTDVDLELVKRDYPVRIADAGNGTKIIDTTRPLVQRLFRKVNYLNTLNQYKSPRKPDGTNRLTRVLDNYAHLWNPQTQTYNDNPFVVSHNCMFISTNMNFIATDKEKEDALKYLRNDKLVWNDLSYLKTYEKLYGKRFARLYEAICELNAKYNCEERCIFAKYTYDRKTIKIKPVRLGIRPEHRNKQMYATQYPISAIKKLHMINYTDQNLKNGFWDRVERSLHCLPYTMVPKKKNGIVYRYRPAFDARIVNQYCYLMYAHMPTMNDLNNFHNQPGLKSMFDIKNFFDCIPLAVADQEYAVAMTPLGLFKMTHLTYGWKNAAPIAQRITNNMCLEVGNMIAYIDDLCMRHPWEHGTEQIVASIEKLYKYCEKYDILLNPSKMFIAADECDGFGFTWGLLGKSVSKHYLKSKILTLEKPITVKDLDNFTGVLGYIAPHIANWAMLRYWLSDMKQRTINGKSRKLVWTPEANIAYEHILLLLNDLPLLHTPTREGQFCIKTDACNYGAGAVLYQKQLDTKKSNEQTKVFKWVICDMWSKAIPQPLRHCHSMVHEAWAVVKACEHWQFQLMKRKFIISMDNRPVANLFTQEWKDINATTQKQLQRLWTHISPMDFDTYHVPGLKNVLADSLSRFTSKMLPSKLRERDKQQRVLRPHHSTDTNNQPLKQQQLQELLTASRNLTFERRKISTNIDVHMINTLMTTHDDEVVRAKEILNAEEAAFNETMKHFRLNAHHTEYDRIRTLVNDTKQLRERPSDAIPDSLAKSIVDNLVGMTKTLQKCSSTTLNHICPMMYNELERSNSDNLILAAKNALSSIPLTEQQQSKCKNAINAITTSHHQFKQRWIDYDKSDFEEESIFNNRDALRNPAYSVNATQTRAQKAEQRALVQARYHHRAVVKRRRRVKAARLRRERQLQQRQTQYSKRRKVRLDNNEYIEWDVDYDDVNDPDFKETCVQDVNSSDGTKMVLLKLIRENIENNDQDDHIEEKDNSGHQANDDKTNSQSDSEFEDVDLDLSDIPSRLVLKKSASELLRTYDDHIDGMNAVFRQTEMISLTRDEFMQEVFGHRGMVNYFEPATFIQLQKDDNMLALVRSLVKTDEADWEPADFTRIVKWRPYLARELLDKTLRVHDDTLQVKKYNELEKEDHYVDVVPFKIRGKMMDYAHHNFQLHHNSRQATLEFLQRHFWWGTMARDVRKWCKGCLVCQFTKGSIRHRAPLAIRTRPKPRDHVFADFLGPVYGRYHILVLVDYATGYAMLIPTNGSDAVTVIEAILRHWIPIFGWFTTFETDWGSGFTAKITQGLMRSVNCHTEIAEPRNHRSVGKVERIIGLIQTTLNAYNLQLGEQLTKKGVIGEEAWRTVEIILPMIQMQLNQRRPRFTTISPNMLMFGSNVNDLTDIGRVRDSLNELLDDDKIKATEHQYLYELIRRIELINNEFAQDWRDYTWLSRSEYNDKYKITNKTINSYKKRFKLNKKVLYYVGDRSVVQGKWKRKWTGPWRIHKILNDSTVIILDPNSLNQKRVSFNRLKLFNADQFQRYNEVVQHGDEFTEFRERLMSNLSGFGGKIRDQKFDLDYTKDRQSEQIQ